ncbi:hypothetical protein GBZ86_14740 [Clostridium tarantellae]|uniref:Uncharacterized protein n=2 Tax=Clostridium tarantellae TaxID=39493 RepID=A0A6I1MPI7_9CLOT|nr:hypothetical protein [Clostridium tarantellae]
MSNNLDSLFNGSENLCGNISKDILSESIINILNESNVTIRACLKYTPKNEGIEIKNEPIIILVKEKNEIIVPYNSTYISLIFDFKNHNEEWIKFEEKTYFDPQNKNFIVNGDINNLSINEI